MTFFIVNKIVSEIDFFKNINPKTGQFADEQITKKLLFVQTSMPCIFFFSAHCLNHKIRQQKTKAFDCRSTNSRKKKHFFVQIT